MEALVARAKAQYKELEFGAAVRTIKKVLVHAEELGPEDRFEINLIHGSCLAVLGRPIDAEVPFRLVVRMKPDFDLSKHTPPKILAVWRKVRVEERGIMRQLEELERARAAEQLALLGEHPARATGGRPIAFRYRLRDPTGIVDRVEVYYRRAMDEAFSSLALVLEDQERWEGKIPASWTENEGGMVAEFYVSMLDRQGESIRTVGTPKKPLMVTIREGRIGSKPLYKSVWFWSIVSIAAAASGVAAYVSLKGDAPDADVGPLPAFR